MSHSVFKDFDEDKNSSSNCDLKNDVADNHLVVFINNDGDVTVDPNGLQNLIGKLSNNTRLFHFIFNFIINLKSITCFNK